jgi:hypothetical protein
MTLFLYAQDVSCYGENDGYIETFVDGGTPPYTYAWSNGASGSYQYYLSQGEYSVTVTDAHGCSINQSATIQEPPEMLTQVTTTTDDPSTPFGEGTATINVIGGNPPYFISWDDPFQQTGVTAINLTFGKYLVSVRDDSWCTKIDTAIVDSALGINEIFRSLGFSLYPNPTKSTIKLEFAKEGTYELYIFIHDFTGRMAFSEKVVLTGHSPYIMDLSGFSSGLYCFSAILNEKRLNCFIELTK